MSTSSGYFYKLYLKVVLNKDKSKVLFAEADGNFADILLSFLTLPLGKVVRILDEHCGGEAPIFGSLTTLYKSLLKLDVTHFSVEGAKQMLVDPATSFEVQCRTLNLDISKTKQRNVYICDCSKCIDYEARSCVSLYCDIASCVCGRRLDKEYKVCRDSDYDDDGVFMKSTASFVICDDLRFAPVVPDFLQMLSDFGITDTNGSEMSVLGIEIGDVMDLFMYSLFSSTPLTDLVIKKTEKKGFSAAAKPNPSCFLHHIPTGDANSRNMILKVFLQKSTNKFLFAVATGEFVEFLFSFLVVPLGGVEFLLGGKTGLKNVDSLYSSLRDSIDDKYFRTPVVKKELINPDLAHGYISKNQFLPLTEDTAPHIRVDGNWKSSFKSLIGEKGFVKEETMYVVRDDLTVSPFSVSSSISIPNDIGISLSDVMSKDLEVGIQEGLSILKASLSSTTPLTDVLIKPMSDKQRKRPKLDPRA